MTPTPAIPADARSVAPVAAPVLNAPFHFAWPAIVSLPMLMAASLVLRLALAAVLPLTADEAYAVAVSRSHALSYYDHPPMMFILAREMADVFGVESPFLMRLPFLAMGTASIWLLHDITRRMYGVKAAVWAAAAFVIAPFFVTFGQTLIVPDGPLDCGLLACLWLIQPLLSGTDQGRWRWPAAGLALGFALLSKYQAVLFGIGAVGALMAIPAWRVQFRRPGLWEAMAIAGLCVLPVVAWNAQNDWVSIAFQTGRTYQKTGLWQHFNGLISVLLGQTIYVLPLTFIGAHRRIWSILFRGGQNEERLLALLALVPILVFDPIALIGRHSLAHWAMSGFLFALPLVGNVRVEAAGAVLRLRLAVATIVVGALFLLIQASSGALFGLPVIGRYIPALGRDNMNWTALTAAIPNDRSFIVAPDWVSAGRISLVVGAGHPIYVMSDPHHFQFMWPAHFHGRGFKIVPSCGASPSVFSIATDFTQVGPIRMIWQREGFKPPICFAVTPLQATR